MGVARVWVGVRCFFLARGGHQWVALVLWSRKYTRPVAGSFADVQPAGNCTSGGVHSGGGGTPFGTAAAGGDPSGGRSHTVAFFATAWRVGSADIYFSRQKACVTALHGSGGSLGVELTGSANRNRLRTLTLTHSCSDSAFMRTQNSQRIPRISWVPLLFVPIEGLIKVHCSGHLTSCARLPPPHRAHRSRDDA